MLKEKVLTKCMCDISWVKSWKQNKWTFIENVCMEQSYFYRTKLSYIFDGIILSTTSIVPLI